MKKIFILILLALNISAKAQWHRAGLDSLFVSSLSVSGTNLFAGTYGHGMYLSTNNGASWTAINTGLTSGAMFVEYSAIKDTNIFIATDAGVYHSTNNGTTWVADTVGYKYKTTSLAIEDTNIYLGTYYGVYKSTNNGASWVADTAGFSPACGYVYSIVYNGKDVYAGFGGNGSMYSHFGVDISKNYGLNWDTTSFYYYGAVALAVFGNNIIVGAFNGIFILKDTGTSYSFKGLTNDEIDYILVYGTNIFAGTSNHGVYVSDDSCNTWKSMNSGLSGNSLTIGMMVVLGDTLFAGTFNGVWKCALADTLTAGIENINENNNLFIYPNPATDNLTIDVSTSLNIPAIIEITNIEGQVIKQQTTNVETTNIVVSALARGMYFVKVKTEKGVAVKKFIKE